MSTASFNMVGEEYGGLTVLNNGYVKNKKRYVKCVCSCGNVIYKRADSLKTYNHQDCRKHREINLMQKSMENNPKISNWDDWTICSYDHNYMVSKNGDIIRTWKNGNFHKLNPAKNDNGYHHITLQLNGMPKTILMHRLMMDSFYGIPDRMHINHIDGNPSNNDINNLEICTASENAKHAYKIGLTQRRYGENARNVKLTWDQICEIRDKYKPRVYTFKMLGEEYGCYPAHIKSIVDRRIWKRKN